MVNKIYHLLFLNLTNIIYFCIIPLKIYQLKKRMKTNVLVIFSLLLIVAASCQPHRTCPTYLKDTKQIKSTENKI
jgi:hypothetical protein